MVIFQLIYNKLNSLKEVEIETKQEVSVIRGLVLFTDFGSILKVCLKYVDF